MSILLPLKPLPDLAEPLWLPGPDRPGLPGDELHIWRARLTGPRCEEEEWDGCPVSRDRNEKLQTALFRNDILARYGGTKPMNGGPAALRMAAAHCDHVALIAVSRGARRLGLDVERVREDIPIEEIAGGFLDARSQWDLRITWSQQEKAWKFFQFWTSNEACAQARPFSRAAHSCNVRGFSPEADFIAALAVDGGPEAGVLFWDWNCHGL
jgi:hypothetical protein